MRNPTDQVVPDDLIKATQSLFRVLDGWTITYIEESDELHTPETFYINGQCCLDIDYKEAAIYPCPGDVDLREYVLHEILHVAFAAADNRDREETFIRDLCTII